MPGQRESAQNRRGGNERNVSPVRLSLLITVVDLKKSDFYVSLLQSFDVNFQLTAMAEGTAEAEILRYLGLTEQQKAVIFSVIREDRAGEALEALEEKFRTLRGGKGIAVTVPFSSVIGTSVFGFLSNEHRTVREGNP